MVNCKNPVLELIAAKPERPLIMGVLNVTHDSFSDGNLFLNTHDAIEKAKQLISEGVDIIDIGGESTRPGAEDVRLEMEIKRVIPVLEGIRKFSEISVSIDTRKSKVAGLAIGCGADIINDVSALRYDDDMSELIREHNKISIVLMHMLRNPQTMQINPEYNDVVEDIIIFFKERIRHCTENGISLNQIILDPGIGFGKNLNHNLTILANLDKFKELGFPLLIGASRKSYISEIYPAPPTERLPGTLAVTGFCLAANVDIIRVHDVKENIQFIKTHRAIRDLKKDEFLNT